MPAIGDPPARDVTGRDPARIIYGRLAQLDRARVRGEIERVLDLISDRHAVGVGLGDLGLELARLGDGAYVYRDPHPATALVHGLRAFVVVRRHEPEPAVARSGSAFCGCVEQGRSGAGPGSTRRDDDHLAAAVHGPVGFFVPPQQHTDAFIVEPRDETCKVVYVMRPSAAHDSGRSEVVGDERADPLPIRRARDARLHQPSFVLTLLSHRF